LIAQARRVLSLSCDPDTSPKFDYLFRVECFIDEDDDGIMREWSIFQCDEGYEFNAKVFEKVLWTIDGVINQDDYQAVECKRK
jgi:hypothetical protein